MMLHFRQKMVGSIVFTIVMMKLLVIVDAVPSAAASGITQDKFRILAHGGTSNNNQIPRMKSTQLTLQCALKCKETSECYGYAINRHDHSCHLRIFAVHVSTGRIAEIQEVLYRVGDIKDAN